MVKTCHVAVVVYSNPNSTEKMEKKICMKKSGFLHTIPGVGIRVGGIHAIKNKNFSSINPVGILNEDGWGKNTFPISRTTPLFPPNTIAIEYCI